MKIWTDEDLRRLVVMWREGVPLSKLAEDFGRTEESITQKVAGLRRQGVPLARRNRSQGRDDLLAELKELAGGE